MSKEARCVAKCGAAPVILKPFPVCALHGLEVAAEVVPGLLQASLGAARREAAAHRPVGRLEAVATAPESAARGRPARPTRAEAHSLVEARLEALREAGVDWMTVRHFRDLPEMTGRSRPWVYMVLGNLVDRGRLVRDDRGDQAGYRFAA